MEIHQKNRLAKIFNLFLDVLHFTAHSSRAGQYLVSALLPWTCRTGLLICTDEFLTNHPPGAFALYLQQQGFTCRVDGDATVFANPNGTEYGTWTLRAGRKNAN